MTFIRRYLFILAVAGGGLLAFDAEAGIIPIDLNDFFADPEVTVSPDGQSASFVESEFATFVRLTNDPFLGDPEVIVAGATSVLSFGFDFAEAADGDDSFSAILFDSDLGIVAGALETFQVTDTQADTASFDLAPYVGLTLGLEFELTELDPFFGTLGSTVTVSNLILESAQTVPEPATLVLFAIGLAGLGFIRRARVPDEVPAVAEG